MRKKDKKPTPSKTPTKPKTTSKPTSKVDRKSSKKPQTQILKIPNKQNLIPNETSNQFFLDLKNDKLSFNLSERNISSADSDEFTNKENPKSIDNTNTNKSIPINKVNPNTKNKNVFERNKSLSKRGGTVKQNISSSLMNSLRNAKLHNNIREHKRSGTVISKELISNNLLSNFNNNEIHDIIDISPIKNVIDDNKEINQENKEDIVNFEESMNIKKELHLSSGNKKQTSNEIISESKTNKDHNNIYQRIMNQKNEMLKKETQYETKKDLINQRLSNLKSKTINLKPSSSLSAIKPLGNTNASSNITDNLNKIKDKKTNSQEKPSFPFQSKTYFHSNNINTKYFHNKDNTNLCYISSNEKATKPSINYLNNKHNQSRNVYNIQRNNSSPFKSSTSPIQSLYSSNIFKQSSDDNNFIRKEPIFDKLIQIKQHILENDFVIDDLIAPSSGRSNSKYNNYNINSINLNQHKTYNSNNNNYQNKHIHYNNIIKENNVKRNNNEFKNRLLQLKRSSEIKSRNIWTNNRRTNIDNTSSSKKGFIRSQSASNITYKKDNNDYFYQGSKYNNNRNYTSLYKHSNFSDMKRNNSNSNKKLYNSQMIEPKKLIFQKEISSNNNNYHINKLKNDLKQYNSSNSNNLFKMYKQNNRNNDLFWNNSVVSSKLTKSYTNIFNANKSNNNIMPPNKLNNKIFKYYK